MNIVYLLLGFFIGVFFFALCCSSLIYGTLKIAYDDGQPYLFLDLDKHPDDILKRKFVIFKVNKVDIKDSHN